MKFHPTPDMLAAAYDYLRVSQPFVRWKLPPSEQVQFHVTKHRDRVGDHLIVEGGEHRIRVAMGRVRGTQDLLEVIAHEMVHAHCDRKKVKAEHGPEFWACAGKVCEFHGFNREGF